jgi:hypothetical protein
MKHGKGTKAETTDHGSCLFICSRIKKGEGRGLKMSRHGSRRFFFAVFLKKMDKMDGEKQMAHCRTR